MTKKITGDMTSRRFDELIAAYGADLRRWPDEAQHLLNDVAVDSVCAQQQLFEAERLDRLLNTAPPPVPDGFQIERMLAINSAEIPAFAADMPLFLSRILRKPMLPIGALALCMLLGVMVGQILPSAASTDHDWLAMYYFQVVSEQ